MASQRLPGKPLRVIAGRPLLEWVWRATCRSGADRVRIATPDPEILAWASSVGAEAVRTGPASCGSERVAAAVADLSPAVVVNVQGDQPGLLPDHVDRAIAGVQRGAPVCTLATPIGSDEDPLDPACVKVVLDSDGRALYFSRQAIPHRGPWWRHLGIYAFRASVLPRCAAGPVGALERSEGLEQLRWLERGIAVRVLQVSHAAPAVDTPSQLEALAAHLSSTEEAIHA